MRIQLGLVRSGSCRCSWCSPRYCDVDCACYAIRVPRLEFPSRSRAIRGTHVGGSQFTLGDVNSVTHFWLLRQIPHGDAGTLVSMSICKCATLILRGKILSLPGHPALENHGAGQRRFRASCGKSFKRKNDIAALPYRRGKS